VSSDLHILSGARSMLVIRARQGETPAVLNWGALLPDPRSVESLTSRSSGPGGADVVIAASLAMEPGLGLAGPAGLEAHRAGLHWASRLVVTAVEVRTEGVTITCADSRAGVSVRYALTLDPATDVLCLDATLANTGEGVLDVNAFSTASLPVPGWCEDIIGFSGRWALEFQRARLSRFPGGYVRENRRGRTSHDSFPAIMLCPAATNECAGEAYGLHLAWSGNHRLRVDTLSDGQVLVSAGALLLPGEVRLGPGETFTAPRIIASWSDRGLNGLSQNFHRHVRKALLRPSTRVKPRPVHYNTWEAVYFDHDIEKLKQAARLAAEAGAERFILDDGWFGSRRDDTSGLGDWEVSDAAYPEGLDPLIDHVRSLGMEMGLWFEPEMVNPDSDLFRAHPEWVLGVEGLEPIPFRNQLALDIARPEVAEHLFQRIDAILRRYPISYIKWDMNRDLDHPGGGDGRPRAAAQVRALYALIERVRTAHPAVEIESCASGGGRADMGVLAHTDRVWTSDTNDALDRQSVQRGASYFLPLEVLGAHVGPRRCHTTGRVLSMAMRAGTALFGHFGMELNLAEETEGARAELQAGAALYKTHRGLLHTGELHRLDTPSHLNGLGVVAGDGAEALFSIATVATHLETVPGRARLAGLDPGRTYTLSLIWPTRPAFRQRTTPAWLEPGFSASGEAFMRVGLELPRGGPEQVLIFHLKAVA
jgi:alpha-galactosidase